MKQKANRRAEPEVLEPVEAELLPADAVPDTEPKTVAKPLRSRSRPGHRHPNTLKNLKRDAGPGRPKGSRNKFSQETVARFVAQYRNDLAADWDKHGEAFIAKCREMFPQIYATMQRMRIEDELSRVQADAGPITISWAATAPAPPVSREPPKQLVYRQPAGGSAAGRLERAHAGLGSIEAHNPQQQRHAAGRGVRGHQERADGASPRIRPTGEGELI